MTNPGASPSQGEQGVRPPVIAARGISKRFGGVAALDDIVIDLYRGAVCGVIGPNGAGKTTLFDILSGVQAPSSGSIFLDDEDVTSRTAAWRSRHGVKRTFQRQQSFGWLTVEENLLVALEWHGGGGGVMADVLDYRRGDVWKGIVEPAWTRHLS